MPECYEAALAANNTMLIYELIGFIIEFMLIELTSLVVRKWRIRRDHKRIEDLLAELEKYDTDREN